MCDMYGPSASHQRCLSSASRRVAQQCKRSGIAVDAVAIAQALCTMLKTQGLRATVSGKGFINFSALQPVVATRVVRPPKPPSAAEVLGPTKVSHTLTVRMLRPHFRPEAYALYRRFNVRCVWAQRGSNSSVSYAWRFRLQVEVHGKTPSQVPEQGYIDFLVESCLRPSPASTSAEDGHGTPPVRAVKTCSACTFINESSARRCQMCSTRLPASLEPSPPRHCETVFAGNLRSDAGADADVGVGDTVLDRIFGDLGGPDCAGYDLVDGWGSYHQEYWLDGKLVGGACRSSACAGWVAIVQSFADVPSFWPTVGVVDVLPHSFCSNYFLYDPDFRWLELGKLSALYELQWTRLVRSVQCRTVFSVPLTELALQAQKRFPSLTYYNMCMYVHRCHRMDYKVKYKPCELLCPKFYEWVPFEECLPRLEATDKSVRCHVAFRYCCFSNIMATDGPFSPRNLLRTRPSGKESGKLSVAECSRSSLCSLALHVTPLSSTLGRMCCLYCTEMYWPSWCFNRVQKQLKPSRSIFVLSWYVVVRRPLSGAQDVHHSPLVVCHLQRRLARLPAHSTAASDDPEDAAQCTDTTMSQSDLSQSDSDSELPPSPS